MNAVAPSDAQPSSPAPPRATTLCIRRSHFRTCWLAFVMLHTVSIAVLVGSIAVAWYLHIDDNGNILNLLGHSTRIILECTVLANAILLVGHLFGLLKMLALSAYFNRLLFNVPANTSLARRSRVQPTPLERHYSVRQREGDARRRHSNRIWRSVSSSMRKHFSRHGSFGIEGAHYDLVYGVAEALLVAMRVFQAYRISTRIPRAWISRMFALLAVLSCFSVPLVKLFVAEPRLKQRVALLVMDLAFDFVTSTVIPTAIFVPYALEYDTALVDFPLVNYYHDTWFVQAVSENRQTFATSWIDLVTKSYPKLSCLLTMGLLKTYVHALIASTWRERSVSRAYWLENGFFIFTGAAVLVIQVHSLAMGSHSSHQACLLEMHPWFSATPHCAVLEIHCRHTLASDGTAADLEALFSDARPDAVQGLIFSSCPRLQMPPVIAQFANLHMIKIYNCTIDAWDGAATLTGANHPNIQMVYIVNTNLTAVPPGLLADDFPPMLTDLEFCGTDLTGLPAEATDKWAAVYYFVLERSPGVTEYPPALAPLQIAYVSLAGNSIRRIPDDLLASQAFWQLYLSHNPLEVLPAQIGDTDKLTELRVRSTLVADLPMWMAERSDTSSTRPEHITSVAAGGSKLCTGVGDFAALRDGVVASSSFEVSCAPSNNPDADCLYPLEAEMQWRARA